MCKFLLPCHLQNFKDGSLTSCAPASIDRLSILGVRSFSEQSTQKHPYGQTIVFTAPLTLIVGSNGSGKTTIIECLKYATSGEMPPNSKGGAFIHDPKLSSEAEVQAQVKLRYFNASSHQFTVSRAVSVTLKKNGTTSSKAVEGNLVIKVHGERTSMSTTVAELKKVVPQTLGVSAAILNNVIFCHQEESLWPMSEPSKLKAKFDEIFEVSSYAKLIENIRKARLYYSSELALLKNSELHLKSLKDKAEQVQKKSISTSDEIELLQERLRSINRAMVLAEEDAKQKRQLKNEAEELVSNLRMKKQRALDLEKQVNSLQIGLEEMDESDQWLQSTLDKFEDDMKDFQRQNNEHQIRYAELGKKAGLLRRQISEKQSEKGRLEAQKEDHQTKLLSRTRLVKEAARAHSLRGYDGDLAENQVGEFVERVRKLSQEKDRELDSNRKSGNHDLAKIQSTISDLESKQAACNQEKITAKNTIVANKRKEQSKQGELNGIRMDEGEKTALDTSYNDIRSRLDRRNSEYEAEAWDTKIQNGRKHLQELESESQRLGSALLQCNSLAEDRAALEYANQQAKSARASLTTMVAAYRDQLGSIVGGDWTPESLDSDFRAAVEQRARTLAEAKAQKLNADQDLAKLVFELDSARAALKKKTSEMEKCEKSVLGSIFTSEGNPITDVDQYMIELQGLEEERDTTRKDLDGMIYVRDYYQKSIDTINTHNCCRLCERAFADRNEKAAAKEKLDKLLTKYCQDTLEQDLKTAEQELKKAKSAHPHYDMYKSLHDRDIPSLQKDVSRLEKEKLSLDSRCEHQDNIVNDADVQKRDADSYASTVSDITKYRNEILKHEEEASRRSTQQKMSGNSMSIDDIRDQTESCNEAMRTLRKDIDKLVADRDSQKAVIGALEKEISAVDKRLSSANFDLQRKRALLSEMQDIRNETIEQNSISKRADAELEKLTPEIAKARAQYDDAQQRHQAKAKEIQAAKDKLADTVNKFKILDDAINAYIENDGLSQLSDCERDINVLEQDQKRTEEEVSQVGSDNNKLKSMITDSEHRKRTIADNIRYRVAVRDLQEVKEEISELKGRNAEAEYEHYKRETLAADNHYTSLQAERGPITGQIVKLDEALKDMIVEWDTDYKNAAHDYKECHIKVETTKAVIDDIGKCSKAINAGIMAYHTKKMEDINAIATELWRSTYQGTDVDSIMIRSDHSASSSTSTQQKYDYRVVMVKQGVEMDMRGRCSAGQKILACIIIRLALAECFGSNCGVIALDEPTTNLDQDNIGALAHSLHSIIKARKHQPNFQLIIITHDEEFLKEMKCTDFCDTYYRVYRDQDQNSIIKRQNLTFLD